MSGSSNRVVTEAEMEAARELCLRGEKLEEEIRAAFAHCTLGDGIGLWEADALDDGAKHDELLLARARDERGDWQRIPTEDLYRAYAALCFSDALGFQFLLPAFMIADLHGYFDEKALMYLSHTRDDRRLSILNDRQVKTVIDFLELHLDDQRCKFHHQSINEALTVFWKPLLL